MNETRPAAATIPSPETEVTVRAMLALHQRPLSFKDCDTAAHESANICVCLTT